MEWIIEFLQDLGSIILASLSILGLGIWPFKKFYENWLNKKFASQLENYKHDHQKELENLRFEINKLLDRKIKINQREFEILPELWSLAVEAHRSTISSISSFQSHACLSVMKTEELNSFLEKCDYLEPYERREIKEQPLDKIDDFFFKKQQGFKLKRAYSDTHSYKDYLLNNAVFLNKALLEKFKEHNQLLLSSCLEQQMHLYQDMPKGKEGNWYKLDLNEGDYINSLEEEVRKILWDLEGKPNK